MDRKLRGPLCFGRGGLTTTRGCLYGVVRKKAAHAGRDKRREELLARARAPFFVVGGG